MKAFFCSLALVLLPVASSGMFILPTSLPVERLVAKGEAYVLAHPEDPQGHYSLARIHYAAFVYQASFLAAFDREGRPIGLDDDPYHAREWRTALEGEARRLLTAEKKSDEKISHEELERKEAQLKTSGWKPPVMTPAESLKHFVAARDGFEKVIAMRPYDPLFALGKASLWRQFSTKELHAPLEKEPGVPAAMDDAEVAKLYYRAFFLAQNQDSRIKYMPMKGLTSIISYEAGSAYLTLAPQGEHAQEVKKFIEKLKQLKDSGVVTPLVFSTRAEDRSLASLITHTARVEFDLGGIGDQRIWPWLEPHAAWLVWDGDQTGNIRDGRQLFGTYTWGVFWRDGFEALSMLDDNSDGVVAGAELKGIAIWQDKNGNAVSDPGEVCSLSQAGILSLRCVASGEEDGQPMHGQGVRFKDGSERPLWDWIAHPHF